MRHCPALQEWLTWPNALRATNLPFEKELFAVVWGLCLLTSCDLLMSVLLIWGVAYDGAAVQDSEDQSLRC